MTETKPSKKEHEIEPSIRAITLTLRELTALIATELLVVDKARVSVVTSEAYGEVIISQCARYIPTREIIIRRDDKLMIQRSKEEGGIRELSISSDMRTRGFAFEKTTVIDAAFAKGPHLREHILPHLACQSFDELLVWGPPSQQKTGENRTMAAELLMEFKKIREIEGKGKK